MVVINITKHCWDIQSHAFLRYSSISDDGLDHKLNSTVTALTTLIHRIKLPKYFVYDMRKNVVLELVMVVHL